MNWIKRLLDRRREKIKEERYCGYEYAMVILKSGNKTDIQNLESKIEQSKDFGFFR